MRIKKLRASAAVDADHTTTTRFTRRVRLLIGWGGATLALLFTWIQFRNFPFGILANSTTPILLWHGGLTLYYISWVSGTKFDVDVQELVYVSFPRRGKMPVHGFLIILLLVVVAAVLLWTEGHIQKFAIAINIFVFIDHLAWMYLIRFIKGVVSNSKNIYRERKDYFALESLDIISYQIQGNWKWWRLTGTIPILILINAFAFSITIHSYLTTATITMLPSFSFQDASAFVSGALLSCFVLVAEVWHWLIRIKTIVSLDFIDKLSGKYALSPRNNP
jgi:hypothetical protein